MKICLTSDLHLGITTKKAIRSQLRKVAKSDVDMLILCGDLTGGFSGADPFKECLELIREVLPDTNILICNGNHEMWAGKNPSWEDFNTNYCRILEVIAANNCHFMDVDGPFIHPDFPQYIFVGHTGWYSHPTPPTNDTYYLPREPDIHAKLAKRAADELAENIDVLNQIWEPDYHQVIFLSHFPVINAGDDWKGRFEDFSWSTSIGEYMQKHYGCKYFLNGHAHQRHEGPLRYEAGSDYYNPRCLILEI